MFFKTLIKAHLVTVSLEFKNNTNDPELTGSHQKQHFNTT